jgi:hypothetical protein
MCRGAPPVVVPDPKQTAKATRRKDPAGDKKRILDGYDHLDIGPTEDLEAQAKLALRTSPGCDCGE